MIACRCLFVLFLLVASPCLAASSAKGGGVPLSVMVGEMIMTGFRGQALAEDAPPLQALREGKIGGLM